MALQYQHKEGNYHLYDLSTPASKVTGEHRAPAPVHAAGDAAARQADRAGTGGLIAIIFIAAYAYLTRARGLFGI